MVVTELPRIKTHKLTEYGLENPVSRGTKMQDEKESSKPDFSVFSTSKGKDGKTFYQKIGAGWKQKTKDDRESISIKLNALPIRDNVVLFEYEEPKETDKKE